NSEPLNTFAVQYERKTTYHDVEWTGLRFVATVRQLDSGANDVELVVEYSEGEELERTGADEYEKHQQEKKLKEYVSSGQVKDLIRLIQVFSVITPAASFWIEQEEVYPQQSPEGTEAMDDGKYSRNEVAMVVTVLLLIIPYVWMIGRKVHSEWTRIMLVGKVRINSSSRNYIFHRTTCSYVQGTARNGYFIHLDYDTAVEQGYRPCCRCFPEAKRSAQYEGEGEGWERVSDSSVRSTENPDIGGCPQKCIWCKVNICTRKKKDHVHCSCTVCIQKYAEELWRAQYDKEPEPESSTTPELVSIPPEPRDLYHKGTGKNQSERGGKGAKRGKAMMEAVSQEQNQEVVQGNSFTPSTYEDYVSPEEMEPRMNRTRRSDVEPGTPDSTEERTEGPVAFGDW
ncbi:unnamed protein product, partial [Symbiodinium sp. CCMP2456]